MPRGSKRKPDSVPTGKTFQIAPNAESGTTDDLSPVDQGNDFVKAGETAKIGHQSS